jgi:hypothetical protein
MEGKTYFIRELQSEIISNRMMLPNAKSMAGMILFKIENNLTLDNKEEKFYEELQLFLKIPS